MKTMSEIIEKIGNMVYDDMVSGFEEYVKNYLSEHNIHRNKTGDKGCNKIKMTRTDIKEMLDDYLYEYIDCVDLDFISEECTDDMIEYIQNGTDEVVFEDE
ncbi:hypothetical protein [Agathobacter sp.]|uniref:hypothetical protein n=1 Tax=Agathobacter sp. TaxID=2021311 RepID=UPI002A90EA15|nr:hypothetical protein [Agathobacter sp.]MDY5861685.1 hypothetical protein [Agathobacter sp.]